MGGLAIAEKVNLKINIMSKFYWVAVWAIISAIMLLGSCKSTKTIQTAMNKKDTALVVNIKSPEVDSAAVISRFLGMVDSRIINFHTFSAKIKLEFTDPDGKTKEATAYIRLRRDSLMWVSLTGPLGIEGFRALIRPDSVWVMDKQEKTITRRSTSYLQEVTKLPLDFAALQDLIVGNPVYFSNNIVSYKTEGNTITALSTGEYFKHLLNLDTVSYTLGYSKIDDIDVTRNRTCFIGYSDYLPAQGTTFSAKREITVTEKSTLKVSLEFKQFAFDGPISFLFTIPKNYKEK